MNNMYDILAKMNLLEGRGSKPDFLDLDRDGDKSEPMKSAAKDMDESIDEGDYSAKKARAGQDIGKPGKNFEKIAKNAGERYGSKAAGERVAGAVLAKLRKGVKEDEVGEGNEFSGAREAAIRAGRPTFQVDGRTYKVTGDASDEKSVKEGRTEYDPVTGVTRHRGSYGSEYQGDDGDDDDFDQWGNRKPGTKKKAAVDPSAPKRGRGRPKGTGRAIGARGPSGTSKLMREQGVAEGAMSEIDIDMQEIASTQDFDKLQDAVDGQMGRATQQYLQDMMMDIARDSGLHYDDDMDRIMEILMDRIVERSVTEASKIGDPEGRGEREAQRAQLAKDHRKLNDLERKALDKAKKTQLPARKNVGEDYDQDEYDEEGEMAQSQARTIEDAAQELQSILDTDENLPEWVQKKISLAMDYIDTARDYMKANPGDQEVVAEKAVSKAQRAAAGIARAAQKGEIPRSELRGASKEMAKMPAGELKKFAKTREKGLPEKVKEVDTGAADARKTSPASKDQQEKTFAKHRERAAKEKQDHEKEKSVKETTTAGSVATAPASGKAKGIFGKGVYEAKLAESFDSRLKSVLNESMSVTISSDDQGGRHLNITATDDDAERLAELLKLAGMGDREQAPACSSCGGMHEGDCKMSEDLANSPDPVTADLGDTGDYSLAGGLNGPKKQVNPNNAGDNPLAMRDLGRTAHTLSLGQVDESVETRLWDIYKRYES